MKIKIRRECPDFDTFRAAKVKSLFNPERGNVFELEADLPEPDGDWAVGVVVGPSGSGKTSIAREYAGEGVLDLYGGWDKGAPIVDGIAAEEGLDAATSALSGVGLGDVPAWLRPFGALSNGQQFRAGLARALFTKEELVAVDEFTSVVDRQVAKVGSAAFAKAWRRRKGGGRIVLASCHYDILDWLEPDWVFNTETGETIKKPKGRGSAPPSSLRFANAGEAGGHILSHIII